MRISALPFFNSRASRRRNVSGLGFPFRRRGRRVRVSLTGYGLVYFIMLVTLLIGSMNHNNNLGYLLTFLLGSLALISIFHAFRNLAGFTVAAVRAEPVFAGQQAAFQCTVVAEGPACPGISFSLPGGKPAVASLAEDSRQTVMVRCPTERRGVLTIDALEIATTYPLNFFQIRSLVPVQGSCLVYPRPVAGPLITTVGPAEEESEGETGGSGVEDFSRLAAYERGDPLQHISWKAYSRGQGLYTKKFEGQQGRTLYFNPDALAGSDLELKLSRICFMIIKADTMRRSYGLILGGKIIPPGFGGSHKRLCLRELALFGQGK